MAQQNQAVFWLTSADYQQLLYVSPGFETIWGHALESLYTYPGGHLSLIVDSIHPSDKARVVAALAQRHKNEYNMEYRIIRPDGSSRWVRSRSFSIQNPFGDTWVIAGLSEDITQCKQAEELLHQRQQEFIALVEHSPDIIARFDRQLRHVYVNPAIERVAGIPPQAFIGKTHQELGMPQDLISLWVPSIQKVFQTGEPEEHEFSYITPQGWGYYHSRLFPELAPNGTVESVLGICRDITAQKQAQIELQNAYDELEKRVAERTAELKHANTLLCQEIAERTRAQEELKTQKDFFQTIIDTNPNVIFVKDQNGKFILANQVFAELYGMKVEDIVGHTDAEIHPNRCEVERFEREDQEACTTLQTKIVSETTFITPTGAVRHFNGIKKPLVLPHEQICLVLGVGTDVTELKQAHEKLKAQKEFLQTVLDTNPNIIFVKDRQGKYILVNQAFVDFFGVTVEEVIGRRDADFNFYQADIEEFMASDRQVFNSLQEQFMLEDACHNSTKELHWFQTIKKPLFSSNGQVSQLLGVCTDITESKRAQEALRLSEEKFRVAINNIPNVFVIYDAQRRIQFVNALGLKTSGKSLEEHLGKTDEELWPDEVTKEYLPILKQAVETRTTQTGECNITLPYTDKFTLIVCYVPLLNEQGEIYQILAITHDITERKQAETRIQESLREKEVLLQEIHHRVKNNLQVISSLLDLQSQYIDQPAMLEVFRESCNRIRSMALIHEQLYEAKNCAKINFSDYIRELANYLLRAYGVNSDQITLELDIEEVTLNINTAIPCGLIINELVSNALKHAFPRGNTGLIQISLHSDLASLLTLIVKDNGIGFLDRGNFKNAKSLGLQLVKILTNQLEGTLELDGCLGTEFKMTFFPT